MTSFEIAKKCREILDNKKGVDVEIINTEKFSALADYVVIATGTSSTHVKALADTVEEELKAYGLAPNHIEGHRSNSWILIDYNDVIVNVFSEETRQFYNLEDLLKE